MAYSERSAKRISEVLLDKGILFSEKKMFAGVCFMVDDKMCCGTHTDKQTQEELLLCRLSETDFDKALQHPDCIPMNFTGKPMKGYVFVKEEGFNTTRKLAYWIQQCLDFNPVAKKSKK